MEKNRQLLKSITRSDKHKVELNLVTNMKNGKSHLEISHTKVLELDTNQLEYAKNSLESLLNGEEII
jgi:hypothetical protein